MSLVAVVVALVGTTALAEPAAAGDGMEVLCSEAGYGCVEGTGYQGQGIWGANHFKTGHNCTSYVSYMLAQAGAAQPWRPMGNANRWNDNAQGRVPVDDTPTIGAVAVWEGGTRLAPGSAGHVGMVDLVTSDYIEVSDDGAANHTRRLRIHRGSPYWPDSFVHIRDRVAVPSLVAALWDAPGLTLSTGPGRVPGWWSARRPLPALLSADSHLTG
jgi:hypothetical protein